MKIDLSRLLILPLHIWDRELDARLLLSIFAAKSGYCSLIGHEYNISPLYHLDHKLFTYGAGRPIFDKVRTTSWYEPIMKKNGSVNLVFEEGLNDIASPDVYRGITCRSLSACSKIYLWHEGELNLMQKASDQGLSHSLGIKSRPCFNSRFELLGDLGKIFYKEKVDSLSNIFGDYVLISDSFAPQLFGHDENHGKPQDFELKNISDLKILKSQKQRISSELVESSSRAYKTAAEFAGLINQIVSFFPQVNFVFRPHPLSALNYWYKNLKQARNLTILYKGSVEPWLLSCRAVLHSGCTTGLQAELADIPAIEMSALFDNTKAMGISASVSRYKPENFNELKQIFSGLNNSKISSCLDTQKKLLNCQIESELFSENIGTINSSVLRKIQLDHGLKIPSVSNSWEVLADFYNFSSASRAQPVLSELTLNQLDSILGSSMPLASKASFYSARDIYSRVKNLCKLLGVNLRVLQFGAKNVFLMLPN